MLWSQIRSNMDEINREQVLLDLERWSKIMIHINNLQQQLYREWQTTYEEVKNG